MGDNTIENLTLHLRHVPDYSLDPTPDGTKARTALPGHYDVGFELGGTFVPLFRAPAGLLPDDALAALQEASDKQAQGGEQPVEPQQTGTGTEPPQPGQ